MYFMTVTLAQRKPPYPVSFYRACTWRVISCLFQRVEPDVNVKRECEEKVVHVDINIPDALKKKLEDDCFYINKRKKVHAAEIKQCLFSLIDGRRVTMMEACLNWIDSCFVRDWPCFSSPSWWWFPARRMSCTSLSPTSSTLPSTKRSWPMSGTGVNRTPHRTAVHSQSLQRRGESACRKK